MGFNENDTEYLTYLTVTLIDTPNGANNACRGPQMMNTKQSYNFTAESRGSSQMHLCVTISFVWHNSIDL